MQDHELKQLLAETHPVLPGQEARAWGALRGRLDGSAASAQASGWKLAAVWRGLSIGGIAVIVAASALGFYALRPAHIALSSADSVAPGIYATSFYSTSAKAQVVWLDGMEPAGKPTYLDPSTPVKDAPPDSL